MNTSKTNNLAELGKWPAFKIEKRSHKIIRHAYEQVVTACARLASFSTGTRTATSGPIDDRQETLAHDDLVDFAIHARRLIENTTKKKRFSCVSIQSHHRSDQTPVQVMALINVIVHHEDIEIIRSTLKAHILSGVKYDLYELVTLPNRNIPPVVIVKSDRRKLFVFKLTDLVEIFQKEMLRPIIDLCAEHDLYLEDLTAE